MSLTEHSSPRRALGALVPLLILLGWALPGANELTASPTVGRLVKVYAAPTYDAFPAAEIVLGRDLLVVFRAGDGHVGTDGRIVMARSTDGGGTWSARTVYDDPRLDDRSHLGLTRIGSRLLLPFYKHNGERPVGAFLLNSSNGGQRWSRPSAIASGSLLWLAPYGRVLQLRKRLLLPAYANSSAGVLSLLLESFDGGRTWRRRSTIAEGGLGFSETSIAVPAPDRLLAVVRAGIGQPFPSVYSVESSDGGRSWSAPRLLFQRAVAPDLINLRSGRLLLCVGQRSAQPGISCRLSRGGRSWSTGKMIYAGSNEDLGYPSSVQLPNGMIFTAFYNENHDILGALYRERDILETAG